MKLIHLSDLHIGKRVNEFSMLEDQEYILKEIIGYDQSGGAGRSRSIAGDVVRQAGPPGGGGAACSTGFCTRLADMNGRCL